jgi:small subunit ribosomal protein S3
VEKIYPARSREGHQDSQTTQSRHDYPKLLHEDFRVKKFLKSRLYHAGISKIEIERAANKAKINIYTARPGIVIGKKGAEIEKLKEEIAKLTSRETYINIHEVRRPDLDAQLVSENVAHSGAL